jgi:HK97 family phage major capsid protein
VSGNVYLRSLREQYAALQKSIAGLQSRAAEGKRDLTNEELRSIVEQGERAKAIFTQIEDLSDIELRNAKVAEMAAKVDAAVRGTPDADSGDGDTDGAGDTTSTGGGTETRATKLAGGAKTQDRDPGLYLRGGQYSFVGDAYRAAKMGEKAAAERLLRHSNALRDNVHLRDVLGAGATTFGAGLVPPVWLAEQFAPVMHKRLRLAAQLRQVPWAGPFAWSIPVAGTVAKTSTVAEGVNTTETDPAYSILTVTPKPIMGYSEVSRQMLEASNPAVDAVIWGDLTGDFYDNAELECITALNGQAGVNTVTVSAGTATTTDILAQRTGILDGIAAISDAPAGDPDFFVGRTARWTTYLKFQDTTGRPLILAQAYTPSNAIGEGGAVNGYRSPIQGTLESLLVVTSPSVAASTGFILNSQEALFSISPPMEFMFEQPAGPALVRIGIWGYEAVTFGRRPKANTKITFSGS